MKINFRIAKNLFAAAVLIPVLAMFVACKPEPEWVDDPDVDEGGEGEEQEQYEDIKVVDGKVRFYLSEKEGSTRTATNMTGRDWAKSRVYMNSKTYPVQLTDEETPRPYVEVAEAGSYSGTLLTAASDRLHGDSPYADVKLMPSQIYHNAIANIKAFPMYASYSQETGNKLIFNDGFAMIYVRLKGSAKISSVKVENLAGKAIAGIANYIPSKGYFTLSKGLDFAVLNCTNEGDFVQLSTAKQTNFRLIIAPGNYTEGLKISICDSERGAMFVTTEPLNLAAGDVYTVEKDYACEDDLVFYEGFDNFVWGGNAVKGESGFGYSPSAEVMSKTSGAGLQGYEDAFVEVPYNNPGTGFVQPNTWDEVSGKTVATAHMLSESYVKSRNIGDWPYMYRVQEFPGYIGSGVAVSSGRGVLTIPVVSHMKGVGDVAVKIRFALHENYIGGLEMSVKYGGVIKKVTVNGKEIALSPSNSEYRTDSHKISMSVDNSIHIPASATVANQWNDLEVILNGATDGARFTFQNSSTSGTNLGIYLDKIEMRKVMDWKDNSNLRVLLWNIQNGMIVDQHNNYENFVKWVKKYDPDICIWCESESIYKDKSGTSSGNSKYLPDGWANLCTRYGHSYAAVGGNRDNYPQTVTSKYPIKTIKKITDTDDGGKFGAKYVSHGAGHFQIEVHGKKINIVTLHMWPQQYAPGTSAANQEASKAAKEGHYFREYEMQYIVNNTVNLPANANEEYWIFGGDTNSNTRLDDWYTKYSTSDPTRLITHDVVLNQTKLKDVIASRDCYGEKTNVMFRSRIDILYVSPKMFDAITNSTMLLDKWTGPNGSWEYHTSFKDPSDHTPVLVEFKL